MANSLGTTESLPFLSSKERLDAYNLIIQGCSHLWSKGQIQDGHSYTQKDTEGNTIQIDTEDKIRPVLQAVVPLAKNDPYFLAHLTSYIMKKSKSKDLQVVLTYAAALSAADGTPFSEGSEYVKPNLRYISAAALHRLDPKLVLRVAKIANMKYGVPGYFNEASHYPEMLRTAVRTYLKYLNAHPERVQDLRDHNHTKTVKRLYEVGHWKPTEEVVKILRWRRKDMKVEFDKLKYDFRDLDDLAIAEKIRAEAIPYAAVLSALAVAEKKVSPVIAVALLEQATGNQAVIMTATFTESGVLDDDEVMKLFQEKVKTAKTALDRVHSIEKIATNASAKAVLENARSEVRKEQVGDIGKIFMHIDDSGSMQSARQYAINHGAIFAECITEPEKNFSWGIFGSRGTIIPRPDKFTKDAFAARLFAYRDGGSTDCFALYPAARQFGADVDVMVTDQGHTNGNLEKKIADYHAQNPTIPKPRVCIIVNFAQVGRWGSGLHQVKDAYEANGIPTVELAPDTLTQTALVSEAIRTAVLGPVAVIDEIMETPLLNLPKYYYAV